MGLSCPGAGLALPSAQSRSGLHPGAGGAALALPPPVCNPHLRETPPKKKTQPRTGCGNSGAETRHNSVHVMAAGGTGGKRGPAPSLPLAAERRRFPRPRAAWRDGMAGERAAGLVRELHRAGGGNLPPFRVSGDGPDRDGMGPAPARSD